MDTTSAHRPSCGQQRTGLPRLFVALFVVVDLVSGIAAAQADAPRERSDFFEIQVVDEATGRGVPLVELETTNAVRYVTDSHGRVALDEPGLFGQTVFFSVRSHGYEFPKDGFGYAGARVEVRPGGRTILKIKRRNIAERLYRVTGADIYRDSVLLGYEPPIEKPLLNAQVYGSDSVVNAVYRGKIHWFWGDTQRPSYPLGNFDVPGAMSALPSQGGLDPDVGINLTYYENDEGFARATADMPGDGPTWIDSLVTLPDADGRERLCAAYVKIKPPLSVYARGLAVFDDDAMRFEKLIDVNRDASIIPGGHPFKHTIGSTEYVYFATGYPLTRVPATLPHFQRLDDYEAFTCLADGATLDAPKLDRTSDGTLRYSWKRQTPAVNAAGQKRLVEAGLMTAEEGVLLLRDARTGTPVTAHGGSVYWNDHRQRWVMIVLEIYGTPSLLGEVWYAEGDSPIGPWVYATKIVSHDRYDFYNPKQHPMFSKENGRVIYFEGTYTNTFSGNPIKTPRYDYNQVMYRLTLDDPRLALPVPVYRQNGNGAPRFATGRSAEDRTPESIAFFALDRLGDGTVAIYQHGTGPQAALSTTPPVDGDATPVFWGLPHDAESPPATTRPLYEFRNDRSGERLYSTSEEPSREGFVRQPEPVCRVWENPVRCTWAADGQ